MNDNNLDIKQLADKDIRLLAFDADDTLWDCQGHFDNVEKAYAQLLAPYADEPTVAEMLFQTETANMPLLGYGSKAFTLSLVENAVKVSRGQIAAADVLRIVELGKSLLTLPATPLPEVRPTLEALRQSGRYAMVVFTKGDLLDQQNKVRRSNLAPLFDDVVVVSDKTQAEYAKLCRLFDTQIDHMLMVGNSFRSDIEPVLQLGGWAVHIPFTSIWRHGQTEEYDHPRLARITHFGQLTNLVGAERG